MQHHLGALLLPCKANAGGGQGLADAKAARVRADCQQANASRIRHRGGGAARAVLRHVAEIDHTAHQRVLVQGNQHLGQRPFGKRADISQHRVIIWLLVRARKARQLRIDLDQQLAECIGFAFVQIADVQ